MARVFAFGIFANDDPVEIGRGAASQRRGEPRKQSSRPEVHVLVETLADGKPETPEGDMVGDVRGAHGAEIDGVKRAQMNERVGRHHGAMLLVVLGSPREFSEVKAKVAGPLFEAAKHVETGGDDFWPDAVSRDHCDLMLAHFCS
jgi:hypothetical protein